MFVAFGIQHAMRKRRIVKCDLPRSAIFSHIISNGTIFGKVIEYEMRVCISSTNFVWNISHS